MSRGRSISLGSEGGTRQNFIKSGVYIPERSPNRRRIHTTNEHVQHVPNIADIGNRHCGGANGDKSIICFPISSDNVQENLEDFEEPSFYDPPPHSSFDEVICIMATPPQATRQTEKLAEPRTEAVEVINLDDLRQRMATHIKTSEDQQGFSVQVNDVRQRINAALVQRIEDQPKIPPLPGDPYDIPPPPKDPRDVVAIIRRARAIARVKAHEEANAPKKPDKKKSSKQAPTVTKSKTTIARKLPKKALPQKTGAAKVKSATPQSQHPPDYVPPEWAAAILRTRTLAGLKSVNPKLIPGQKTAATKPKSPLRGPPSTTPLKNPTPLKTPTPAKTPTFENVLERVAALRSRTQAIEAASTNEEQTVVATTLQDELDEFEVLEELYGAEKPEQYPLAEPSGTDLQSRINALKQQLFESSPTTEPVPAENLDQYEATSQDEFEALEEQYGARQPERNPQSQQPITDLQQRINALRHELLQTPPQVEPLSTEKRDEHEQYRSPSVAAQNLNDAFLDSIGEANINDIHEFSHPSEVLQDVDSKIRDKVTPQHPGSRVAASYSRLPKYDDAFLENIDIPDFDVDEVPEYAFTAEALKDAGFEIEDGVFLEDISLPPIDEDISLDALGLDDISAPILSDLSKSVESVSLEPEYPSELSKEENAKQFSEKFAAQEISSDTSILTTVVNAVVERLKNIFSSSSDEQTEVEESLFDLDTSLPNIFKDTPPKVSPPRLEDPTHDEGIDQRDGATQKRKESPITDADSTQDHKREKGDIKSHMKGEAPIINKKTGVPKKKKRAYAAGEYSPSYVKAVARARSLAGLKNLSALLNPQRAARIAEQKALREAEEAAIEALPPVERMREKMKKMRRNMGGLPRPSIEALATLEAIRASLPKRKTSKRKWRPAGRLRVDRRVQPSERLFWRDFGRIFAPSEKKKKYGLRPVDVMSPIVEETKYEDEGFIQFSPLRPHEGRKRLDYLKERAARQTAELIREAAEKQAAISNETPSPRIGSPRTSRSAPHQFSPIKIQSPTSPRTEESRREKIITQIGPHGGQETVREEVIEISKIENGEIHTSTRQVTTKTDEYGNVTQHVAKGKGFSGEDENMREDLDEIQPPDFLDTSDIPPPLDASIPSPAEIINRIRSNVQQRISLALPNIRKSPKSSSPASPAKIDFPQDLTDEKLFDVKAPAFERTPKKASPQVQKLPSVEKDQRMYAWGEMPPKSVPREIQVPKHSVPSPESAKLLPRTPKRKSLEDPIRIPPHPKDPKDYKAMVKRAQAIEKLKQQEKLAAKTALQKQTPSKAKRVPISRWTGPGPRALRRPPRKRLVLKKRAPKTSPKKTSDEGVQEHGDVEIPSKPPALPEEYIKAVARARLIRGFENRTAMLNPAVAERLAAEDAAQAAFDALPEVEKIRRRMQILRERPTKKRPVEPSAEVLGTLAAIRANMPPLEDVQHRSTGLSPKSPTTKYQAVIIPQAPVRARSRVTASTADMSLEEFELMERYLDAAPVIPEGQSQIQRHLSSGHRRIASSATAVDDFIDPSLEAFENLEAEMKSEASLEEFEALEAEAQKLYDYYTPKQTQRHKPRRLIAHTSHSSPHPEVESLTASSMRMLQQAGYLQDIQSFDQALVFSEEEALPKRGVPPTADISRVDAESASFYYELLEDFRIPAENVMESSQLLIKTPPRNLQERFQRLKEAQSPRKTPSEYEETFYEVPTTPVAHYSPIRLISPSAAEEREQATSISTREENELLLNIDETPDRKINKVKQLRDLEDMPFDQLEYEIEPRLADISFEKPLSPPPQPSDIIRRIRTAHLQQLKELAGPSAPKSIETLKPPDELPDEELLDQSSPSFTQTPRTPPVPSKSPQVSPSLAKGESRPVTSATLENPTPIQEVAPRSQRKYEESSLPEGPIVIPPHPQDPRDYTAMIMRARVIYKLKQKEAEKAADAQASKTAKKGRVPISRWQGPPPKKISAKPRQKLVLRKRVQKSAEAVDIKQPSLHDEKDEREYEEPPPLPQEYRDAVARARLLRGLKNRTAALNPQIAAQKIAKEAAVAAFNALPEIEKIKIRLQRLRRQPQPRRAVKPTMEQIAYLEAMKQIGEYQKPSPRSLSPSATPLRVSVTPRSRKVTPSLSLTPRIDVRQIRDNEYLELAEFEALELSNKASAIQPTVTKDYDVKKRIDALKGHLLEDEELPQIEDEYLAEFEALEALLEAVPVQHPTQTAEPLDISKLVSDMRHQLVTPPRLDPRERYKHLLAQRKTPTIPVASPVETPEIRYSPIKLASSPSRAEKSITQTTRRGNDTIKEQSIETSEMVNGKLQHFKALVTTTTDPQGIVTSQINESKRISARDRSAELAENLENVEEPSFLDTTPVTPLEQPRPRDIIDRVGRQLKERYRPQVPTGHLVELRTPPAVLPLPTEISEEELTNLSIPSLERTLPPSPVRSPTRSPEQPFDISIPEVFAATPPPPTPPLPPVSPLRYRIPSPEGPIVVPRHPKDPTDYKAMVRRARKIQQLIKQKEAEARAAEEEEAKAAAERAKAQRKERVPISKWTAPPPRKPGKRRKLVLRKRGEVVATKAQLPKKAKLEEEIEQPPALPEHFAQQIALARKMAGLKTSALRQKVVAREAAIAKANEAARVEARNMPPRSPIKDYTAVLSRMKEMKERGVVVHSQPSVAAAAYLDALKGAMQVRQNLQHATESPRTRYNRILAARTAPQPAAQEIAIRTPVLDEIHYSPIRLTSPHIAENQIDMTEAIALHVFDRVALENLDEVEELSDFEQPSYIDFSQHEDQRIPLTPPTTPPHVSSAVISRIRQQYKETKTPVVPQRLTSPQALEFPENLTEEEIFELSALSFAQSPIAPETSIKSPDITIPHYFEESPAAMPSAEAIITDDINTTSPPLPGVIPGIKVKTPQRPIRIPDHPKDPTDVAAMIRRAQLIQKLKAKELAAKAPVAKVRATISRRVPGRAGPKKDKVISKPTKPTKITSAHLAQVARSRGLAEQTLKTSPISDTQATTSEPSTSYISLMERYIALRALKQKTQQIPTARELAHRQHLINRQQRRERRRLLHELERLRQQQGFEFEPTKTPPTARERLQSIKSRIPAETPNSSAYPHSPIKTPEVVDVPQYQPILLATTPPYQFLENVDISDIENISMPLDDLDNYTIGFDTADEEDIEFQLEEIKNTSYAGFNEYISTSELEREEQDNFDIAERIKMLQHELLQSPDSDNKYNMIERMELLKAQLLQTPTQQEPSISESMAVSPNFDEDEQYNLQDNFEDLMSDFEAMEREYL